MADRAGNVTLPSVLLDTSALLAFLRGEPQGRRVGEIIEQARAAISAISVFELCAGVTSERHLAQRNELISLVRVIPTDARTAQRAASIFTTLRSRGVTIDNEDLLIAATALEHDLGVYSINTRHFEAVPDLRLLIADE